MSVLVVCGRCKKEFEARRSDAKWCKECGVIVHKSRTYSYELRKKAKCQDCGKPISRRSIRCHLCDNISRKGNHSGSANPNWRGGVTHPSGYIYVRLSEEERKGHAYRAEHIIVWEKTHGKKLPAGWVVHHLNGIKSDNRPENLLGLRRGDHHKYPFKSIVPYQRRILELEKQVKELQQLRLIN